MFVIGSQLLAWKDIGLVEEPTLLIITSSFYHVVGPVVSGLRYSSIRNTTLEARVRFHNACVGRCGAAVDIAVASHTTSAFAARVLEKRNPAHK